MLCWVAVRLHSSHETSLEFCVGKAIAQCWYYEAEVRVPKSFRYHDRWRWRLLWNSEEPCPKRFSTTDYEGEESSLVLAQLAALRELLKRTSRRSGGKWALGKTQRAKLKIHVTLVTLAGTDG